ncbi:hypothetical protein [Legionella cardiaca]|uniref:Uncharacterized protein n=1 Tax=Legionella cardiaca TaxID=1071983 RepID=A0ABY8AVX9_9GAMM|nr:hypothetical protein [Legionella cardiaca]WED43876.1 hypothetical protein PXX05_03585 [Legionella cardiaca]
MPKITAKNMHEYYDFVAAKEGGPVTVLIGKKKSTDTDSSHPDAIVFKQGLGAPKDRDASIKLQGRAGFLPVIAAGDDYFIREAYPSKIATKWSQVQSHSKLLIRQAMELSLIMLQAGVVDRDRSVLKGTGDNLTARNLVISDRLYFFDFEPEYFIDWSKELTSSDAEAIELWKTTHENLIKGLAANLGLGGQVEALLAQFHVAAEKILAEKNEQALKIWHGLVHPVVDSGGEYEPPSFTVSPTVSHSSSYVTPSVTIQKPNLAEPTVEAIFDLMKSYYGAKPTLFRSSLEDTVDKMARLTHVVNNREGSAYLKLEAMINKDHDPLFRKVATSLLENTKQYLDKAYTRQLHDKDELWARPKGPWGSGSL